MFDFHVCLCQFDYPELIKNGYLQRNLCSLHIEQYFGENEDIDNRTVLVDAKQSEHLTCISMILPSRVDMNFGQHRSGRWSITAAALLRDALHQVCTSTTLSIFCFVPT